MQENVTETRSIPVDDFGQALTTGDKLLHGQYTIQCYLSSGGFGVTYLARDSLDRKVVIKECFPGSICIRKGRTVVGRTPDMHLDFKKVVRLMVHEARRMARLSHPNIVGVHQVFEDNGTAYMALDFVDGRDLQDIIEHDHKRLTPEIVKNLLVKVLNAIEYIHENDILHRDISPDNILIDENNEPVLIDFGAAREVATRASRALSTINVVKDGYSPQEFYSSVEEQTPASDLYSLGATFYHAITGKPPPDSQSRLSALVANEPDPYEPIPARQDGYDYHFLASIDKALALFAKDRLFSAAQWMANIDRNKRQIAMLEAARHDKQVEQLIKQITTETNEALEAEVEQNRVEEAIGSLLSEGFEDKAPQKPAPPDHGLGSAEWEDLFSEAEDDLDCDDTSLPKQSLIARFISSPLTFFASEKPSVRDDIGRTIQ